MKQYTNPTIEIYIINKTDTAYMELSGPIAGDGDGVDYDDLDD